MRACVIAGVLVLAAATGCAGVRQPPPREEPSPPPRAEEGLASYYGRAHHGKRTASGERFDLRAMTCAHKSLPFGTKVRVTDLDTGRSVVVRVNDRGPFAKGRVVDLSLGAARALGIVDRGVARVRVEPLPDRPDDEPRAVVAGRRS